MNTFLYNTSYSEEIRNRVVKTVKFLGEISNWKSKKNHKEISVHCTLRAIYAVESEVELFNISFKLSQDM